MTVVSIWPLGGSIRTEQKQDAHFKQWAFTRDRSEAFNMDSGTTTISLNTREYK